MDDKRIEWLVDEIKRSGHEVTLKYNPGNGSCCRWEGFVLEYTDEKETEFNGKILRAASLDKLLGKIVARLLA